MKTTLILCSMAILLGVLFPSASLAMTAEDIVSQLTQREQGIISIRGKFNVWAQIRMNDGEMVELEKQYEWAKSGDIQKVSEEYKLIPERFKQNEPNSVCKGSSHKIIQRIMTEKKIRAFDGNVSKMFYPENNNGSIHPGKQGFNFGKMPADWLLLRLKKKPFSVFLKQDTTSLKYAGLVQLDGRRCHLLEISTPQTNERLYLADEQGLVPVRFESNIINRTLPHNTRGEHIFSEFKRYGNITMPTRVVVSVFDVYPDREQLAMKEIFTVEQMDVNIQIPDADLLIQFPPGTHVFDSVANKIYIVDANSI